MSSNEGAMTGAVSGVPAEAARLGRQLTRAEILLDKDGSQRIWHQAVWDGNCLRWIGRITHYGYGQVGINYRQIHVHRLAYELAFGPIPDGYHVDHVAARGCKFRDCINPDHLEAVTPAENVRRTYPRTKPAKRPTHCRRGHDYSTNGSMRSDGSMTCDTCRAMRRERAKTHRTDCPNCGKEMYQSSLAEHLRDHCRSATPTTPNGVTP